MNAKLRDTMAFILKTYPDNMMSEMSNARLTKMVYLGDWKSVLGTGKQITPIQWYFDNYGPYVDDVKNLAHKQPQIFKVEQTTNMYGQPKRVFDVVGNPSCDTLTEHEKSALSSVIDTTSKLYWAPFIKLVYATHPIASSERYSYLNLVEKAEEYKKLQSA